MGNVRKLFIRYLSKQANRPRIVGKLWKGSLLFDWIGHLKEEIYLLYSRTCFSFFSL